MFAGAGGGFLMHEIRELAAHSRRILSRSVKTWGGCRKAGIHFVATPSPFKAALFMSEP